MTRYRWPDYELQLLGELQRQQNSAQFCDTLLQTEGISVPTHSCVLSALSPYLSQKLSASPSPPSGQKRQLQLQAVKAQTLLKLVGLLYSGELEVKGSKEQNDVLAAAHRFGIAHLVEEQEAGGMKEGALQEKRQSLGICRENGIHTEEGRERQQSLQMQDAQVQAGGGDKSCPVKKKSCVSIGTQTVKAGERTVGTSVILSGQSKLATPEPASSVAQSLDFSTSLQPQNIIFDRQLSSTPCPTIPSDEESPFGRSSGSKTNPASTSALSSDTATCPVSLNNDSSSPRTQEYSAHQESSASGETIQVFAKGGTGLQDDKRADSGGNAEQVNRHEMLGEDNSAKKRHAHASAGVNSLSKMKHIQQMVETTQISIKVKLRRRTKGEVWEVVSLQDTDETLSVLTPQEQDSSNHKTLQRELKKVQPPPSTVCLCPVQKPENLQAATAASPKPPNLPNTSSHPQTLSSGCFSANQSNELESVLLPQPQAVEESDEQMIERLLEDIMNILPNLEMDCKKPQLSHDGAPNIFQIPVTEDNAGQMHAVVSTAGYQDLVTQGGHPSTDTGIHRCSAQNQPTFTSLSTVQPDVLIQQQQCCLQYDSSPRSLGQSEGISCPGMPPSRSQNSLYPEASSTTSVMPSAFFSSGQKLHYPAFQQPSSQKDQHILEFLPLPNGNEMQSEHTFSLPYLDNLQFPQCLSPLEAYTSTTKHLPLLNNSTNPGNDIQQPPSLQEQPLLSENLLQFPLNAFTCRENKGPQDTSHTCCSMRWQKRKELNPKNEGICSESAAELKSDPKKLKESLKRKEDNTAGEAAVPKRWKRKGTNRPRDPASSILVCKGSKVKDGTKSCCSQSLSSSNVQMRERKVAISSSDVPYRLVEKPTDASTITESVREKTKGPGALCTEWSRIRTRSVVKKSQETAGSKTAPEKSYVLVPVVCRAKIGNMKGVLLPRQKCGRPQKKKLEKKLPNSVPAIVENKGSDVESELQNGKDLSKVEDKRTMRRGRKRRRNRSGGEIIPLKNTVSADADNNSDTPTPKQPPMITLKDFQNLIKQQHSKKSQKTTEPAGDVETEAKTGRGGTMDESAMETEMDIKIKHNITLDKNHNQLLNTSAAQCSKPHGDDTNISASEESGLCGDRDHPVSVFDVEEEAKMSSEREQTLKNPDEGLSCGTGGSDALQSPVSIEGSPHSEAHQPRENKTASDQNLNPQYPKKTGPPDGIGQTSGCDRDEEEVEEEEEVDVLLYSPDKVPQSGRCEDGRNNMVVTLEEEEEEEDVNEIDVTGDEAE